jgi:hypothetical protein
MYNVTDTAIEIAQFPGYLLDLQSSVTRSQFVNSTALVIGSVNRPSSSQIVFQRCSITLHFSDPFDEVANDGALCPYEITKRLQIMFTGCFSDVKTF